MRKTILLLILFILIPSVLAKEGHMKLMAVSETSNGEIEGSTADLYLNIRSGNGGVFIDTYPITKIDTQISTRFAKEITCGFLDMNCDNYDFIYTIRGKSSIIGGPSAGAAMAVLTATMLKNKEIMEDVAITGTINSGGIIGPVAGIKEKIEAAAKSGIKKVIIPNQDMSDNESNTSLQDYEKEYGIIIVKVDDLSEALYEYNGMVEEEIYEELIIEDEYKDTMKYLAETLCDKNKELQRDMSSFEIINNSLVNEEFIEENKKAINLSNKGEEAFESERYYSSASYCYGANVKLRYLLLILEDMTKKQYFEKMESLMNEVNFFDEEIETKSKETITDLETYMIVKERIKEAKEYIKKSGENQLKNESYVFELAYAIERFYSAESWSNFFGKKGKRFELGVENLKDSCLAKIGEAEERYQYVKIFFPTLLTGLKEEIDYAYSDFRKGEYDLCLFKASKAKAEADLVLTVIGVNEEQIDNLLENKEKVAERIIMREIKKGIFPIVGYSYFEYAKSLKEEDKYSALLYLEYALELSSLDIYFKEKKIEFKKFIDLKQTSVFFVGLLCGIIITLIIKKGNGKKSRGKNDYKTPRKIRKPSLGKKR